MRSSIDFSCTQRDLFNKWKCEKGSIFYGQHSFGLSRGNLICEPKVEKKGGRTRARVKATSTNTSVVANQNQSEDQQR
ncbi:MAG: hypothetical protein EZS28_001903 [Streblomastix strix]|uniref:Uncharacterized protein n=1 Tax=Streblomastix strix TaxID=222440 RepID=A0A5J4X6B7_9EUKA|nr:MAG: hypothetical protein EZS28_001903 [Streblomastix strix]